MSSLEPANVRDLLTEMKDVSDLMVDLAYASIFFEDRALANCMSELEKQMDDLMYQIRAVAVLVTRNLEEAKQVTEILQVASGAEAISNATGDMADLVRRNIKIHPVVREAFSLSDEQIMKIKVGEDSELAGSSFRELKLSSRMGVWTFGIRKGKKWILLLPSDTHIEAGDTLLSKGPREGLVELCRIAGSKVEILRPRARNGLRIIRRALAEMRDLTVAMIDMAYSSLFFNSREIAEEVEELEEKFDRLNYTLWLETLKAARHEHDLKKLSTTLQLVRCMERISDAAALIAGVVKRDIGLHPIFSAVLADSQEQIGKTVVSVESPLAGRTLEDAKLWKTFGVQVFMVKRGRRYIIKPHKQFKIKPGDVLFIRGGKNGVERIIQTGEME